MDGMMSTMRASVTNRNERVIAMTDQIKSALMTAVFGPQRNRGCIAT